MLSTTRVIITAGGCQFSPAIVNLHEQLDMVATIGKKIMLMNTMPGAPSIDVYCMTFVGQLAIYQLKDLSSSAISHAFSYPFLHVSRIHVRHLISSSHQQECETTPAQPFVNCDPSSVRWAVPSSPNNLKSRPSSKCRTFNAQTVNIVNAVHVELTHHLLLVPDVTVDSDLCFSVKTSLSLEKFRSRQPQRILAR